MKEQRNIEDRTSDGDASMSIGDRLKGIWRLLADDLSCDHRSLKSLTESAVVFIPIL